MRRGNNFKTESEQEDDYYANLGNQYSTTSGTSRLFPEMQANSIDGIDCSVIGSGITKFAQPKHRRTNKNAVDLKISIDAIAYALKESLQIAICSDDRDYEHVFAKLAEFEETGSYFISHRSNRENFWKDHYNTEFLSYDDVMRKKLTQINFHSGSAKDHLPTATAASTDHDGDSTSANIAAKTSSSTTKVGKKQTWMRLYLNFSDEHPAFSDFDGDHAELVEILRDGKKLVEGLRGNFKRDDSDNGNSWSAGGKHQSNSDSTQSTTQSQWEILPDIQPDYLETETCVKKLVGVLQEHKYLPNETEKVNMGALARLFYNNRGLLKRSEKIFQSLLRDQYSITNDNRAAATQISPIPTDRLVVFPRYLGILQGVAAAQWLEETRKTPHNKKKFRVKPYEKNLFYAEPEIFSSDQDSATHKILSKLRRQFGAAIPVEVGLAGGPVIVEYDEKGMVVRDEEADGKKWMLDDYVVREKLRFENSGAFKKLNRKRLGGDSIGGGSQRRLRDAFTSDEPQFWKVPAPRSLARM